ncbi:hypothetical protein [Streptomyces sp. SYP-A7185]|uniref:hypothetical protein n=1 Tax=Streptomyces sp. SYP-A7185 TaxID=3040076 RepID=UPI0038F651CD
MSGTTGKPDTPSKQDTPPKRVPGRFSDDPPDPLASLLAKIDKGEHIAAPGDGTTADDRDPTDEEYRRYERDGPYAQGRRRKN